MEGDGCILPWLQQPLPARATRFFSFPHPCPDVFGLETGWELPSTAGRPFPKRFSSSGTRGWEGYSIQLGSAAPSLGSARADDGLEQERCCAGRARPYPTHPPRPPHPGQGPRPPASCKSCRSTGRVESQPAAAAPACAAKRRMMPADTPAGMRQLHLWWKPGEITGATRGTDSVPAIRKLRITAGLHFLHIAKPSIPEIPRQVRCKGTRSKRHLPSLSASICGPLTPQSLSPCQKAVI